MNKGHGYQDRAQITTTPHNFFVTFLIHMANVFK